ncbi:MAG TPA: hypothetical protein VMT22_08555 [Terriglobales bacterium]|nr:hypothetical protein [Terriglobales bacterium]
MHACRSTYLVTQCALCRPSIKYYKGRVTATLRPFLNDAARNPISGITGGIADIIVGQRMDHDGATIAIEY